jgi:dihydroxy-acid dehydratase
MRSDTIKRGFERAPHRSLLRATGQIRDGDIVRIDLAARRLEVEVLDEELAQRRKEWTAPAPKYQRGWLARYTKMVTNASNGAILE